MAAVPHCTGNGSSSLLPVLNARMYVGDSPTQCFQLVVFNITLILNYSSTIPATPQSMASFNQTKSKSVHILSCRSRRVFPKTWLLISPFLSAVLTINFIPESFFLTLYVLQFPSMPNSPWKQIKRMCLIKCQIRTLSFPPRTCLPIIFLDSPELIVSILQCLHWPCIPLLPLYFPITSYPFIFSNSSLTPAFFSPQNAAPMIICSLLSELKKHASFKLALKGH